MRDDHPSYWPFRKREGAKMICDYIVFPSPPLLLLLFLLVLLVLLVILLLLLLPVLLVILLPNYLTLHGSAKQRSLAATPEDALFRCPAGDGAASLPTVPSTEARPLCIDQCALQEASHTIRTPGLLLSSVSSPRPWNTQRLLRCLRWCSTWPLITLYYSHAQEHTHTRARPASTGPPSWQQLQFLTLRR